MDIWSFANQMNNDFVMSFSAIILSQILQAVSGSLKLVPHGLGICRTLLQDQQLKSIARNLSADKSKAYIISPTLRLLREAVALDGGAYARGFIRSRALTFASLGRNLELGFAGETQEDARKASVRTNAIRFFLGCLRYASSDAKRELLMQRDLLSHLTFMLKTDPPYLILEILDVLKTHVLMDDKILRDLKARSFNSKILTRFLPLYTYTSSADETGKAQKVPEACQEFLIFVCTNPKAGVLQSSTGLYPKETDDGPRRTAPTSGDDAGADGWDKEFGEKSGGVPVYNFALSDFARKLRPWSSLSHSELLVSIFKAAPELVSDYFVNNSGFTLDPKLSMTWIGYAAFVFQTMTIPLPRQFGNRTRFSQVPPPTSILLDNILPQPINEKVLTRCLSLKSQLTSLFAMRIMVLALNKLSEVIEIMQGAARKSESSSWYLAIRRLLDAFCQRLPDMKEISRCYKGTPETQLLQRTMASRLLRLYYEVIPRVALAANFDVSTFFNDVLRRVDGEGDGSGDRAFSTMELEDLVSIASYSPGMRWFIKLDKGDDDEGLSSFTALLKVFCNPADSSPLVQLKKILTEIATEAQLNSSVEGLSPLIHALKCTMEAKPKRMGFVWSHVDDCIRRCSSSPIKYLEILSIDAHHDSETKDNHVSLLCVTMVDQLSHIVDKLDSKQQDVLSSLLSYYFNALALTQDSQDLLQILHSRAMAHLPSLAKLGDKKCTKRLRSLAASDAEQDPPSKEVSAQQTQPDDAELLAPLSVPITLPEDTSALIKWGSKSVDDLIEDDWPPQLISLLQSEHVNIRKEAHTNILKMAAKIKESVHEEKNQIWLLLSELAESSRPQLDAGPAPSAFVAFATHGFAILKTPLHPLYPKVNTFLTRGPIWSPDKIPLAHDVLHGEPSEDDRYYTELAWLLDYLLDAFRTPFDLGVFHRKLWIEKILMLGSNPHLRSSLRNRLLRIVLRATEIEGGSTTLVTRFGILSWLEAQGSARKAERPVCEALMRRVWETCDQTRVKGWSKDGAEQLMKGLSREVSG